MHKVTARYSSLFCGLDCGNRRGGTDRLALVGLMLGDWQLVSWRTDARTAFSAFVSEGDVARFAKGLKTRSLVSRRTLGRNGTAS